MPLAMDASSRSDDALVDTRLLGRSLRNHIPNHAGDMLHGASSPGRQRPAAGIGLAHLDLQDSCPGAPARHGTVGSRAQVNLGISFGKIQKSKFHVI